MRSTLAIEATEPRTMRELLDQREAFKGAARIIAAPNRGRSDLDALTDPCHARMNELEVMAADIEIKTLDDLLAAFDVFRAMKGEMDCDYGDRRDANLLDAMRRAVVHIMGRREAFGSIEPEPAPTKADASGSISSVEIADALNEVRHSLALALELAEARAHRSQSDLERAAVNGLVDLLYQQIDRLEALERSIHPKEKIQSGRQLSGTIG